MKVELKEEGETSLTSCLPCCLSVIKRNKICEPHSENPPLCGCLLDADGMIDSWPRPICSPTKPPPSEPSRFRFAMRESHTLQGLLHGRKWSGKKIASTSSCSLSEISSQLTFPGVMEIAILRSMASATLNFP